MTRAALKTRLRLGLAAAAVTVTLACATPPRPYGQPQYRVSDVPQYRAPARPKLGGDQRLLVIGALDDLTVQPIGGQYNEVDYSVGPLQRTFTYWALPSKLADELHAALRRRGVRVVKSYRDLGAPVPFAAPRFARHLVVLRGEIVSFSYSRHSRGFDVIVATLDLKLLENSAGKVLWRGRLDERFRAPIADVRGPDPFALLGERLAAALLADARFGSLIGARRRR